VVDAVRREADGQGSLFDSELPFWDDEISQIIKGRCRGDLHEYLEVERVGRGSALSKRARATVWKVYELYTSALKAKGWSDWDDLILRALDLRESDVDFQPYDYVFLDEAQDLAPVAIELVAGLVPENSQQIFIVADAAQSIYHQGFRWKDVGLKVRGRSFSLGRNFRSTVEIVAAAQSMVARSSLKDDPDVLASEHTHRHGPQPRLIECRSLAEEIEAVVGDIDRLVRLGLTAPGNISVLARSRDTLQDISSALEHRGIKYRRYDEGELVLADPSVKVVTLHSGKGLEFPVVYIVDVNRGRLPQPAAGLSGEDAEGHLLRERKLFYVGMTRAIQELTVTFTRGRGSTFLDDLDRDSFEVLTADELRGTQIIEPAPELSRSRLTLRGGDSVKTRRGEWMVVLRVTGQCVACIHGGQEVERHLQSIVGVRRGTVEWTVVDD
jgi:superfamily I DNA/RNA helicase